MKSQLEKIIEQLRSFLSGYGRIRAAVTLAKLGQYRAANRLINSNL